MGAPESFHIISGQHDIILQGLADLWHTPSGTETQESQLLTCCWLSVYGSTTLRFCLVTCSGTAVISSPCKPQELNDHKMVVANRVYGGPAHHLRDAPWSHSRFRHFWNPARVDLLESHYYIRSFLPPGESSVLCHFCVCSSQLYFHFLSKTRILGSAAHSGHVTFPPPPPSSGLAPRSFPSRNAPPYPLPSPQHDSHFSFKVAFKRDWLSCFRFLPPRHQILLNNPHTANNWLLYSCWCLLFNQSRW